MTEGACQRATGASYAGFSDTFDGLVSSVLSLRVLGVGLILVVVLLITGAGPPV